MKANTVIRISKKFSYQLVNNRQLSLLYLPIIGVNAFSLYNLFVNLADKEYPSLFFTELLGLNFTKIKEATHYLEAAGLITTYQHKEDSNKLVFIINPPMSANSFKNNDLFIANLLLKLNNNTTSLEYLFEQFKTDYINLDNYNNISKQFMDIFSYHEIDKEIPFSALEEPNFAPSISNYFNYDNFIKLLPINLSRGNKLLFTNDYERKIIQLAFAYQLKEEEIAKIYISLANKKHNFKFEELKDSISIYAKDKTSDYKKEDITTLDEISPLELVKILSNNNSINNNDLNTTTEFHLRHPDIKKGILNALIIFIYKTKDGELPHVNYLDKVLNNWLLSKNITSTSDAINFLNSSKNNEKIEKNKKVKTNTIQEERAKWHNEMVAYIQSIPDGGDLT